MWRIGVRLGPEGLKIFNAITFERDGDDKKVDVIIQKINSVNIWKTNEIYDRFIFNKRHQKDESIEAYVTELKQFAKTCKFCDYLSGSLIRDRIMLGIANNTKGKFSSKGKTWSWRPLETFDILLKTLPPKCRSLEMRVENSLER